MLYLLDKKGGRYSNRLLKAMGLGDVVLGVGLEEQEGGVQLVADQPVLTGGVSEGIAIQIHAAADGHGGREAVVDNHPALLAAHLQKLLLLHDGLDAEAAEMVDVEVGDPDLVEYVRAENLGGTVAMHADPLVGPAEVVEHVGGHCPLHHVEVVEVQQAEPGINLERRRHRRRIHTEEKAKIVAAACWTEYQLFCTRII